MREMRNADCGIAARLSPLSSCTAWFQALLAICNSAIRISSRLSPVVTALDLGLVSSSFGRNPQSAIRISSRLSPVGTALDFGLVSSSFGNFAIRNPHFLRISSRLSPVATALDLGLVSSSFGNFAIRIPQSACPPHFLSPFARRHRS